MKYGSRKVNYDGHTFDSKKECRRYMELMMLQQSGKIRDLKCQVKYGLIPPQRWKDGKLIERGVDYIADFVYRDCDTGYEIVEDAKGCKTREYIIKRKLMLYMHGIRVKEV